MVYPLRLVNRREHFIVNVLAYQIVEHLNEFENVMTCIVACKVCPLPDPFSFQRLKEANNACKDESVVKRDCFQQQINHDG